jgi:hypothetical protein
VRVPAKLLALAALAPALLAWGPEAGDPAAADNTQVPAAGLDFSMGIDTDGDTTDDCSSSGTPTNECTLAAQETFRVNVYLNSLPDKVDGYEGIDIVLPYIGVRWTKIHEWPWPEGFCFTLYSASGWLDDGRALLSCATFGETSTYLGLMATTDFTCDESGSITMVHGLEVRTGLAAGPRMYAEGDGTTETLTIVCAEPPTPTPTTTPKPTCTSTPPATPVPLMGDVDCDGWVNSIDALLILQYHAALIDSLPCLGSADMGGDGRIDSIDAFWVLKEPLWLWPARAGQAGSHPSSSP